MIDTHYIEKCYFYIQNNIHLMRRYFKINMFIINYIVLCYIFKNNYYVKLII